jgi:hypothetical protein
LKKQKDWKMKNKIKIKIKKTNTTIFTLVTLILVSQFAFFTTGCNSNDNASSNSSSMDSYESDIIPIVYPSDSVKTIKELGMDDGTYIRKNRGSYSYLGNSGHKEPTLVISPDYTLTINGQAIPVYSTVVYLGSSEECALHSYAIVDVKKNDIMKLDVILTAQRYKLNKATILPASLKTTPMVNGNNVTATISKYGDYSFLMNDEESEISQFNAFTLFVREYADEETEIKKYKTTYGEENVKVYEPGTHYIDYIDIKESNTVIYIRRGALLIAKGKDGYGENTQYTEIGAKESNGWGLERYPLITLNYKENIKITGNGTIDAGQLGWHERRGLMASNSSNIEISGLTLLNFPEWTLITYCCSDINIHDINIFGYKTNSDGIAICNTINASVSDCFIRSGDDLFEVKTLGGPIDAVSKNVTFSNCIAWASKARCFGIISEMEKDISEITFRNCAVIYRDATWDNKILGSLVVIAGSGSGNVSNVTFENIEIFYDYGRAINLAITGKNQTRTKIENIVFRNIVYNSAIPNSFNTNQIGTNKIEAVFDNVVGNGKLLTSENISNQLIMDSQSSLTILNKTSENVSSK